MNRLILVFHGVLLLFANHAFAGAQEDLLTATMQCDVAAAQKALDAGADVNAIYPSGQNALAAAYFCPEVTKLLLDKGGDPNGGSYPALITASNCYSIEVMKLLLDGGADPNAVGVIDAGATLRKMLESEKAKGRKANKVMVNAWEEALKNMEKTEVTALQQTVQQTNCVPCLEMLLQHGADVNKTSVDGGLMHTLAAFSMEKEMRKDGFTKGAPVMETMGMKVPAFYGNLPDDINGTPGQMLDLLAKAGLDVNVKRSDSVTAFMVALTLHKLDLAKAMMRNGADAVTWSHIERHGPDHVSYPICAAAEFADVELMQMILDQKPDINVKVKTHVLGATMDTDFKGNTNWGGGGYTPLIISIMSGHTDIARLLLENGASVKIGSSGTSILNTRFAFLKCLTKIKNKTPIYWAVEQEDLGLVEIIAKKMEWRFNPDFTITSYTVGGGGEYKCANFKKKQSPSIYAMTVGNKEAYKLLSAKGL